jgi:hypothetical protein
MITLIVCRLIVVINKMMAAWQLATPEPLLENRCESCAWSAASRKRSWLN